MMKVLSMAEPRPQDVEREDDQALFARVRAGETALFAVIMRRHNQNLYRIARGILRDDGEAEDVVQQAYLSALTGNFRGDAQLSTWLTRIVINESLARLRKRSGGLALVADEPMNERDESPTPEDRASTRELAGLLENAIDALPDHYRTVFVLREIEELTTEQTAGALALSEEAVRVRLHRARTMLRADLDQRLGEAAREVFRFDGARCDRIVAAVLAELEH
jgi:RNA polymerase sigma-70 factor, ECF subfamily